MSIEDSDTALRIVEAGRQRVAERVRDAFVAQTQAHPELGEIDPPELERLVQEATDRAGASLWRVSLAEAAAREFSIPLGEALRHPTVASAEQLVGAPPAPTAPSVPPAAAPPAAAPPAPPAPPADGPPAGWPDAPGADTPWATPAEPEPVGAPPEPIAAADPYAIDEPYTEPEWMSEVPADETVPEWMQPEPADGEPAAYGSEPAPEPLPEPELAPEPAAAAPAVAPPVDPATQAIRVAAVHTGGIEALKPGDKDLELRLSDAGLDVIKKSSGVAIGRLEWTEITTVEVEQGKKGLRGRKPQSLQVRTSRGQASFELPGLSEEEAGQHVEPLLQRLRDSGQLGSAAD